jgi:hypothetical protein
MAGKHRESASKGLSQINYCSSKAIISRLLISRKSIIWDKSFLNWFEICPSFPAECIKRFPLFLAGFLIFRKDPKAISAFGGLYKN